MKQTKKSGFTLVELAIVLVIIGLIVGGVLVGQDLIKAAEIRNSASQIEKYNTAATAFRTKYDGYPGDLISTRATNFNLTAGAGTDGLGDGDGVLENGATAANKQGIGGENDLFWRHLSSAEFIADGFVTAAATETTAAFARADIIARLPTLKIRDTADVHVTGISGRNYFWISNISGVAATTGVPVAGEQLPALSPVEAENIDSKVDDGVFNTGIFRAFTNIADATTETIPVAVEEAAGVCVGWGADNALGGVGANADSYNITAAFGSSVGCRIRWRSSF